jgi:hypothetical protein
MSGGEVNPANTIAYTVVEAVDYAGLIVTRGTTADYMVLAADASADEPEGYTYTDSKKPSTIGGASQTGQRVGIHALIEGQIAEFVLPAAHDAISVGDRLCVSTGGTVIKYASGASWVVGRADEAIDQNAGGYVQVRVSKRYIAA